MTMISVFSKLSDEQATPAYLGGKGHGLWWMQQQGVNVPPAIIIPTTACVLHMKDPKASMTLIKEQLPEIKQFFVDQFGYMPLLSVRSGARVSMPGMMDTILNVGLDTHTEAFWVTKLGPGCTLDSYRRLITMYGSVVKGIPKEKLEDPSWVKTLSAYTRATGESFPDADQQILNSVQAVFDSWNNERAMVYRKMNNIPEEWGTAVVIQAMVFGNMNENSGTGVLFTRNPDSGENMVLGEFLTNAQGEDVVDGSHTGMALGLMHGWNPEVAQELLTVVSKLETAKRDVQDVEFTIQDGKLYVLQTRTAKRSARAAVKIALDMVKDGMITPAEAIKRVSARELDLADQPVIDPKFKTSPDYTGIPACSGVVTGVVATSSEQAVDMALKGKPVIMVTHETTPDDIKGMVASVGILTMNGGSTSHAAVVARSMNRVCVVGLGAQHSVFKSGQEISLDGATGRVWLSKVPVIGGKSEDVQAFRRLILEGAPLVVDRPPVYAVEDLVLDLTPSLVEGMDAIRDMVHCSLALCNTLTVMLTTPTDAQREVLRVYFTDAHLEAKTKAVRLMIESYFPADALKVIGWQSPVFPAINCVQAKSLAELALLESDSLLMPGPMTAKEVLAFARISKWLAAEGIQTAHFNTKGGVAAWTVHLHG